MATLTLLHNNMAATMVYHLINHNMADLHLLQCTRMPMRMATKTPLLPLLPAYKILVEVPLKDMPSNTRIVREGEKLC